MLGGNRVSTEDAVTEGRIQIPSLFFPPEGEWHLSCKFIALSKHPDAWQIIDLHKIFVDDESYNHGHGRAYETLGISKERGASIIVRPDQYISMVTSLENVEGISKFFEGLVK